MDVAEFLQSKVAEHRSRVFQTRVLLKPTVIVASNAAVAALLAGERDTLDYGYQEGWNIFLVRLFGYFVTILNLVAFFFFSFDKSTVQLSFGWS